MWPIGLGDPFMTIFSIVHTPALFVVLFSSFCEAIERRGLIEEDNTLDECLTEATLFQMPSSLRRLFATILVFCEPHDVMGLWKKHYDAMSEDYIRNHPSRIWCNKWF